MNVLLEAIVVGLALIPIYWIVQKLGQPKWVTIFLACAAGLVGLVGIGVRALHVGSLHVYVYWFLLGAALLWAFVAGAF
jgi:hypothetical protein